MDIARLQKALAIMVKDEESATGNVFGYHDEIQIYPMADSYTDAEVKALDDLGFRMNDEGGFDCFT